MAAIDFDAIVADGRDGFPGLIGVVVDAFEEGWMRLRMAVTPSLLAPNGFVHGGAIVSLADTACGYGCLRSLPDGADTFTTIDLSASFTAAARSSEIICEARRMHGGRTTQVWDATVSEPGGRPLALVRCTQLILFPRATPETGPRS